MKLECPNCGSDYPDLPEGATEHQARLALRAVLLWYAESPIREIQMAEACCGIKFPIRKIEAALTVPNGGEALDDRAIMAKSFSDTLDLVDLFLSGDYDPADNDRVREIVRRFRALLARSNARQQTPGARREAS